MPSPTRPELTDLLKDTSFLGVRWSDTLMTGASWSDADLSPTGRFPKLNPIRPSHDDKAAQLGKRRFIGVDVGGRDYTAFSVFDLEDGVLKAVDVKQADYSAIEQRIMAHALTGTCTAPDQKPTTLTLEDMLATVKKVYADIDAKKQRVLGWTRSGPLIRAEGLMALGACEFQQRLFEAAFRHMVIITPELIEEYGPMFDACWLMEQLVDLRKLDRGQMYKVLAPFPIEDWKKRPHEDCRAIWRGLLWVLWEANNWRSMAYDPSFFWRHREGAGVVSQHVV